MTIGTSYRQNRDHYTANAVTTASPTQLVLMLYDGALASIQRASTALEVDHVDIQIAHKELTKAQDIVMELTVSLDHELGGVVAASLAALYDFCHRTLVEANTHKSPDSLGAVTTVINELRSAWIEACAIETQA